MQAKLGAGFLIVAFLYVVLGLAVPRLGLAPGPELLLLVSCYVVVGLGASLTLSSMLSRRLRGLAQVASEISKGDLSRRIDTTGTDEVSVLARALALMTESLLNVVLEVRTTAERIRGSAQSLSQTSDRINSRTEEIAETARAIADGAVDQAEQISRTTRTNRELLQAVRRVSSRADDVHASAMDAAARAADGASDARVAVDHIRDLGETTAAATAAVEGFRRKAGEIGSIVNFITSISNQTQLLAINAAIEAARAGEEGHGFAVLSEEVSRLADNVRRFAEQISTISDEIMRGSEEATEEIRRAVAGAGEVEEVVERAAASFDGLIRAVHGTADRAGEISGLSGEQQNAAEAVTGLLEEISRIAEQNARGTEEASAATREQTRSTHTMVDSAHALAETSDQLRDLIAIFRLH